MLAERAGQEAEEVEGEEEEEEEGEGEGDVEGFERLVGGEGGYG